MFSPMMQTTAPYPTKIMLHCMQFHRICPRNDNSFAQCHTFRRRDAPVVHRSIQTVVASLPHAPAAEAATAAAATLLTAPPSTLQTLVEYIRGSIDPLVFGSTTSASFKLFLVCAIVGWLLRHDRIPNATASVLSMVSFQLLIPCMLFSRVAKILSTSPDPTLLIGMAIAAVTQIAIGAAFGSLLAPLVDGSYPTSLRIFGWHPLQPEKSAAAIANATAAATGLPHAAAALLPKPPPAPRGLRQLVVAACAFGNTFTLPAVFFLSLLPAQLADTAIAYSGLFLLAWSPCMWSAGLSIVEGGFAARPADKDTVAAQKQDRERQRAAWQSAGGGCTSDVVEVLATHAEGETADQEHASVTARAAIADADDKLVQQTEMLLNPAVTLRGVRRWVVATLKHNKRIEQLKIFFKRVLNPPVVSILGGMAVGLTPFGKHLFAAASSSSSSVPATAALATEARLPLELSLAWAGLKNAYEVVEMLAGGTLAMQTLVLAASLLQRTESGEQPSSLGGKAAEKEYVDPSDVDEGEATKGGDVQERTAPPLPRSVFKAAWRAIAPVDALEGRALAVLSLVRFVLLPTTALLLWRWLGSVATGSGMLSSAVKALSADPLFLFVLAVQCVMPSAQNLIIMLQLSPSARPAAPAFARMLLKLYAYAVLPVTLWVTAFASRLAVPLA